MTFHLEAKVSAVKVDSSRATIIATKDKQELKFEADKVLVSVGRRPFSDGLGAEKSASKWTNIFVPTSKAFVPSAM
jgi:dihydrolipoamide dehydrogenase